MTRRRGEHPWDRWSFVHLASGAALGFIGLRPAAAFNVLVGFEGLEGALRRIRVREGGLFEYESWANVAADIAVGMVGYYLARQLKALPTSPSRGA